MNKEEIYERIRAKAFQINGKGEWLVAAIDVHNALNAMPEESTTLIGKCGNSYNAMPEESEKRKIEFDWLCGNCGKKIYTKPMETDIAKRKIEEFYDSEGRAYREAQEIPLLEEFEDWLDNK